MADKTDVKKQIQNLKQKEQIVLEQLEKNEYEGKELKNLQSMLEDTLRKLRKDEVELRNMKQRTENHTKNLGFDDNSMF